MLTLLPLFALPVQTAPVAQPDPRPNILVVYTDDHACRAVGAYGAGLNETPSIDRIAREGVLFLESFCANSICAPARASVLTGKHSHANGQLTNGERFDGEQTTFPKLLQASGYQTALLGKWHLRSDPTGFDHWEVLTGQGHYYNPVLKSAAGTRTLEGYATELVTDLALEWLRERDPERPFLLMCQHKAPHRTWAPAPSKHGLYRELTLPEPATLFDDFNGRSATLRSNEMSIAEHFYWDYDLKVPDSGLPNPFGRAMKSPEVARMTPPQLAAWNEAYGEENAAFLAADLEGDALVRWKYQRYVGDYLRTVDSVDESVGRLLDALDEGDLFDNTIVVYASDQGFYLGEHGWYDKRWIFEESLRTPFTLRWPAAVAPGLVVEELVQNIDLAPTLLDAAGVAVPDEMQGESLLPLLTDGEARPDWRDAIYYTYYEEGEHAVPRHEGLRSARHKLVWFPGSAEWQLFDLEEDPNELRSLHASRDHQALFVQLKRRLSELRLEYGADPWPLPPLHREHEQREIEGFTVHVERALLEGPEAELGARALATTTAKLHELAAVVPPAALARLREVPIWIDLDHPLGTMQYHPSRGWLEDHGYDPAMTQAVHVPDARRMLATARTNHQPWVFLHELAHAYHDRVLGFDEPRLAAAHARVQASGEFEEVLHINGSTARHYALTDPKEFFAEMSECYFGTNDFHPFVRAELARDDPETFALLAEIWGPLP